MRALVLVVASCLLLPSAGADAARGSGLPLVTLTSATTRGTNWALKAGAGHGGASCVLLMVNGRLASGGCGRLPPDGLRLYAGSSSRPAFVVGFVVSTARRVEIKFSDGMNSAARALILPDQRQPRRAFFVASAPCHTYPTAVAALGQDGRTVARFTPPAAATWRQLAYAACWDPSDSPPPLYPGAHSYLTLNPGVEVACVTPGGRIVAQVPKRSGDSQAQLRQADGTKDILMVFQTHQSCLSQP